MEVLEIKTISQDRRGLKRIRYAACHPAKNEKNVCRGL